MSTRTSRGRISRMRPLTMLPSLKSRNDFAIKSCICNIRVSFLLRGAEPLFCLSRRRSYARLLQKRGSRILARMWA